MRWVILAVSILILIPFPTLSALGILIFFFLPTILHPKPIPVGYHYEFDAALNGPRLVKDDEDDQSPDDS